MDDLAGTRIVVGNYPLASGDRFLQYTGSSLSEQSRTVSTYIIETIQHHLLLNTSQNENVLF